MANDLNCVSLVGRLVRDIEIKYLTSGTAVGTFSIAVNRSVKNGEKWEEDASFIECVAFGKTVENLGKYLVKGKQIGVVGSIKQDRWQDKESGANRSKIVINAINIQLLGGGTEHTAPAPSRQTRQGVSGAPANQGYPEQQDFQDDIPFN